MTSYVALLRGINVGGNNRVPMAELRQIVQDLGHADVASYIQSGNVVFSGEEASPDALGDALETAITDRLGVTCDIVVITAAELRRVIADNPFPGEQNPKKLHAVFHRQQLSEQARAAVADAVARAAAKGSPDDAAVLRSTLYMHTPDGLGRSLLDAELSKVAVSKAIGRPGTARNWNTVAKLAEMLEALG